MESALLYWETSNADTANQTVWILSSLLSNVIKIALSQVTALNKNLWIWTWIIHAFQIISV